MPPRAIQPQDTVITCAMCGRTLLQGENPEFYLFNGTRRAVCDLCTVRANHQGWIRESEGPQIGHRDARDADRGRLRNRLRSRRDRRTNGRSTAAQQPEGSAGAPEAGPEAPREPRHVHAVPTSDELKVARAVEVFNAGEHPRTVAGVARSLGPPAVSVHPSGEDAALVTLVASWELCWYRYEVDLAGEGAHSVRLIGQGYELSELDAVERTANAAADEHGLLALA